MRETEEENVQAQIKSEVQERTAKFEANFKENEVENEVKERFETYKRKRDREERDRHQAENAAFLEEMVEEASGKIFC